MAHSASLCNKVVFLTGASSGIGRATAWLLDDLGASVVLVGRSHERLTDTAKRLKNPYLLFALDVADLEQLKSAVDAVKTSFGHIDIVIANAGLYVVGEFTLDQSNSYKSVIDTNVIGVMNTVAACLSLLKQSSAADVIVTSSISGHEVLNPEPVYTASKHAVQAFVHSLRVQLTECNIRVGSIAPGKTLNELWGLTDENEIEALYRAGQGIKSEDVAEAILFMLTRPRSIGVRDLVLLPSGRAI